MGTDGGLFINVHGELCYQGANVLTMRDVVPMILYTNHGTMLSFFRSGSVSKHSTAAELFSVLTSNGHLSEPWVEGLYSREYLYTLCLELMDED